MAAAVCAAAIFVCSVRAQEPTEPFAACSTELRDAGFADKEALIGQLGLWASPYAPPSWLRSSRICFRPRPGWSSLIAASVDEGLTELDLSDAASGQPAGTVSRYVLNQDWQQQSVPSSSARPSRASPWPVQIWLAAARRRPRDDALDSTTARFKLLTQRQAVEADASVKRGLKPR